MAATAVALSSVNVKSGRLASARSTKSATAGVRAIWASSRSGDLRRDREPPLAVVEEEQQPRCGEDLSERREEALTDDLPHAECRGNGRNDEGRIGQRREIDEGDPIRKLIRHPRRDRERQPRLAGPARSGQRDEPDAVATQGGAQGLDLRLTPDQPGQGCWQGREPRLRPVRRAAPQAVRPRRGKERRPIALPQRQRVGQQAHGLRPGRLPQVALQVADPAHAQAGALGQLLLGQRRRAAQPAEQLAEGCRAVAHRRPPEAVVEGTRNRRREA
jgi:hypothetical protein